jgi:hypothetical protein
VKVSLTTISAVMLMAILAAAAGSALADDNPPAPPTETTPALTMPAVTTTDPADSPAPWAPSPAPPADPVTQVAPVILPVPGHQVRIMLMKHVRAKLVPARKTVWHLQSLMGLHRSHGGNIWNLGSPQAGQKRVHAWKKREHKLLLTARRRADSLMDRVNYMNRVMGTGPLRVPSRSMSVSARLTWAQGMYHEVLPHYHNPRDKGALMCIHRFEGSWTDPNAPFWGGLQMNLGFQSHYGGWLLRQKGTADHWTMWEQIWTAEKAIHSGRGFYPWPNTARYCGLI